MLSDASQILCSSVYGDGLWSVRSCVGLRTTHPPLGIQFCAALPNRAVFVSCRCCSLFRSQMPTCMGPRLIPDLSGLFWSPGHDSQGLHLCCCPVLNCPCCSQPVPGCRQPLVPRHVSGHVLWAIPFFCFLLVELMELIWDSVFGYF